ncbi:hypothetical protein AB0O22_16565 [Streptomyces sp. NPDC091204]|uniref:hypothetical protein n=1 Tax=Streptomyces sp. NPDC091204 TaxID=3155299 RepID=UPI0034355F4B
MHPPFGIPDQDTMELFPGEIGAYGTAQVPPVPAATEAPVFVDTSGRRQRRVRRWGYLLVVPAVAYVVLLMSTLLGGPTFRSSFLPSAQAPQTPVPGATAGAGTAGPSPRGPASSSTRRAPAASRSGAAPSPAVTTGTDKGTPGTGQGPTKSATGPADLDPSPRGGGRGRVTAPPGQGGGKPTGRP